MKAKQMGVREAKTHLSELLNEVQRGRRFLITKYGKPIAELGSVEQRAPRRAGFAKGLFRRVAEDFDTPVEDMQEHME